MSSPVGPFFISASPPFHFQTISRCTTVHKAQPTAQTEAHTQPKNCTPRLYRPAFEGSSEQKQTHVCKIRGFVLFTGLPGIGGEWVSAGENPVGNLSINVPSQPKPTPYPRTTHSPSLKNFQKCAHKLFHELEAFVAEVWSKVGPWFEAFGILCLSKVDGCESKYSLGAFVFQESRLMCLCFKRLMCQNIQSFHFQSCPHSPPSSFVHKRQTLCHTTILFIIPLNLDSNEKVPFSRFRCFVVFPGFKNDKSLNGIFPDWIAK